ncbi:hypothetical protein C0J52_06599 [Blattella germanica]|nr:hypothetical protein C0J52_06599 [Blattella germanica]
MELLQTISDTANQKVQRFLQEERIKPRPGASSGVWMSFLLPTAVILGANINHNVSEVYHIAATLSFGLLATSAFFLFKKCSSNKQDYLFIIPPVFTYIWLFFYNKIGIWFSVAGGFASYSFSEAVILLLDANPKSLTYGEASVVTQSLLLFLYTASISLVNSWYNMPVSCMDISTLILQVWLVLYWVVCSGLGIIAVTSQVEGKEHASTVVRKHFHILAVVVFIPGLIRECCFLYLATGVVLALFVALELLRVLRLPPLGDFLQSGFAVFADEKDAGTLALTPIYLLVGCSLPLWLYPVNTLQDRCTGQNLLPLLSGILTIGVGDTAASVFGTWFGRTKWKGTKKTKEGTLASIICQIIVILLLTHLGYITYSGAMLLCSTSAVVLTSVLEAKTDQVDNLALPLVMYILLLPLSQ